MKSNIKSIQYNLSNLSTISNSIKLNQFLNIDYNLKATFIVNNQLQPIIDLKIGKIFN